MSPDSPRDVLFDLAVTRAAEYAARMAVPPGDPVRTRAVLEVWYLKTRFAYRVPLDEVAAAVSARPSGPASWSGGREGGWSTTGAEACDDRRHGEEG